jgi:hypothetical protein
MFKHFRDYYWNAGKPYGIENIHPSQISPSYKIVSDPYYKHISIEKYRDDHFEKVIYDSFLLDFRHLTLKDQIAWEREILKEEKNQTICLLRNQDDRVILIETLSFEQNLCRTCLTSSVHGIPLSIHRTYYRYFEDPFDGVVLYDFEGRPVMMKIYETDQKTGEFTQLLTEEWNMQIPPPMLQKCLN